MSGGSWGRRGLGSGRGGDDKDDMYMTPQGRPGFTTLGQKSSNGPNLDEFIGRIDGGAVRCVQRHVRAQVVM